MKDALGYEALPALFIKFADSSHVDSGYRLLMHCVRHAFERKTPSLDRNTVMLVLHQGKVSIHLITNIPASMKSDMYQAGIVATANEILSCKCNCQCSSKDLNAFYVCTTFHCFCYWHYFFLRNCQSTSWLSSQYV